MFPDPSEHLLRFVGDRLRVRLEPGESLGPQAKAFLRTNLTRAAVARAEVIADAGLRPEDALTFAGASWRDIPLERHGTGWMIDLPLLEVGHFRAKAYWTEANRQHWPEGGDLGISVHPDKLRTANLIYCVFPRTTGGEPRAIPRSLSAAVTDLDERGFTVIPPSGTLRGLTRVLPHIFETLGCRILHLLPIGPVPSTYARMGRYGSPYAQLDLTGVDPALVEFDRRTNAIDQFRELTDAVHLREGMVLIDIVLNHTGWGSRLLDAHPEWFHRNPDGTFHSPGAWGTVWEDLVELDQQHAELWDVLAEALLTWCRRGVDGFRCDAGYMVPLPAWQYIVARVRREFPDCVFLLEGLGGAWEATEALLTRGGMQWAYSELFQCFEPAHVSGYLDHAWRHGEHTGVLVHYSETHDNDRLAKRGARWSLMRNRLSALASQNGGFGFSAGVEWLCSEKFDVHEARSLFWGHAPNLVGELARLNQLLRQHPCFFDGAHIERVSEADSPVLALHRSSHDELDHCLALINLDVEERQEIELSARVWLRGGDKRFDLLGQPVPAPEWCEDGSVRLSLSAGQSFCLSTASSPRGLAGDAYRLRRAQAAWAYLQLGTVLPHEAIGPADFSELGGFVAEDPARFLASLALLDPTETRTDLLGALERARARGGYPRVVAWHVEDARRITLVPPGHWVLVCDSSPFEVDVAQAGGVVSLRSIPVDDGHVAALPPEPGELAHDVSLAFDRFGAEGAPVRATLRRLASTPSWRPSVREGLVLLTNGRGAMARLWADLGAAHSKYDCLLGANLHPEVPCDRHVLVKRVRAWVNADGFITALNGDNLVELVSGPPAVWTFAANAGDGRRVGVRLSVDFLPERNSVALRLARVSTQSLDLPPDRSVRVTLRFDLEDRVMHAETHADSALERRFAEGSHPLASGLGFAFDYGGKAALRGYTDLGSYHHEPEWSRGVFHAADAERGLADRGDAFSPGWFDVPLATDIPATVVLAADREDPPAELVEGVLSAGQQPQADAAAGFEAQLRRAARAFLVKRGRGKTVIAGYPWFLDWGRDSLIAARGLIAAGHHDDVKQLLLTYAAFERDGTLPNYLAGEGEGSRETSDAPMWFGLACEELAERLGQGVYDERAQGGRSLGEVLRSIARGYLRGTPHGVGVDPESGLVWSPTHFTWMDTNYPAGTPREGYPIELSVMFARLLRQLARIAPGESAQFLELAARTERSLGSFYRPELGFCADTLHAARGVPASAARADDHLRPNQLLAVSLGLFEGERARAIVAAAERYLLVPGAMRTLAPRPVSYGLPLRGAGGQLLNDGSNPYWGHYTGDEDTRRKPAYHNGTAWGWWLPTYCEALVRAYPGDSAAVEAARAVLGSTDRLLREGCIGQLPEIIDGDAPHTQRGCDAQAWSVTEALRVWLLLERLGARG